MALAQAQQSPNPTLIIGVWESATAAPRAVFTNGQVTYTEAEPINYQVKGNKIIYKGMGQTYTSQIVTLTFDRLVEKTSSGNVIKWTRVVEIPSNDAALLQGDWVYRPADQGMPSYLSFRGKQVDMGMMGNYSYHIKNKRMYFKNIKGGADFSQKIVYINKKSMGLSSAEGSEIQVYVKK
ncbi:hypothetical protein M23134_00541 [Microscilla marina ATCC 23134]|uniref:Lipocalin-like domain-containing protein n=2 Tax=Microscilla marina TaxID=1027 RepID=A1ZJC1_MICM2|nr:hypothetical protein M23134_00541 [Microscilla marina ATCC 23134]